MTPKSVISSLNNAQIKNLVLLQRKAKAREEQGTYIIEGVKMFEEARLDENNILLKAYVSESFYDAKRKDDPNYFSGYEYEIVTDSVFKEISETKTPQGILASIKYKTYRLEELFNAPNACLMLLEDIRDPGNLGTIVRTAEGAGVTGIILNNSCVDIYNPKVIRSTMGSIYRVPFYYTEDFIQSISQIKARGIKVYAAHLLGKSYDAIAEFKDRCAFLIGNEANGLSVEAATKADTLIKIPMVGKVESLNAAVAAAILMFEVARQRRL